MLVEVIEFYPIKNLQEKKSARIGTFHFYLPDIDVDLRGVGVYKTRKKGHMFFQMPMIVTGKQK